MKKLFFLFLLLFLSIKANANDSGSCGDNLSWSYISKTQTLTISGTGAMYDYKASNAPWIDYRDSINKIIINDGVTSIGKYAFAYFSELDSVDIPYGVFSIGTKAFYYCPELKKVSINNNDILSRWDEHGYPESLKWVFGEQVEEYIIGNGVTRIGSYVFDGCKKMKSVEIPSSVTSIGEFPFRDCSDLNKVIISDIAAWCRINFKDWKSNPLYYAHNLYLNDEKIEDLVIPNSVTSIESYAFIGCSGLTSVEIPCSVTSIGNAAFKSCSGLVKVNISDLSAWCRINFNDSESNPLSMAHSLYLNGEEIVNLVIPNDVSSIRPYAFYSCYGITSVTIPSWVTSIGGFLGCTNLKTVIIDSDSLLSKQYSPNSSLKYVFGNNVEEYVVGNSVTSIGAYAFCNCSYMKSIDIPSSITSIGYMTFSGCSGLTKVNISDIAAWCGINFIDWESNPLYYAHNLYLNDEIIDSLIIPNSVTSIGDYTFYNCSSLNSVEILNGVASIGDYAFYNCSSMNTVKIPNSVTSIGLFAFYNCSGLAIVDIPSSVISIGYSCFAGCKSNIYIMSKNVTFPEKRLFESDNVYGFSYLNSISHDSYYWNSFTPFDTPSVLIGPFCIIFQGISLLHYDDEITSYELEEHNYDFADLLPNKSYQLFYTMNTAKGDQIKGFFTFKTPYVLLTSLNPKVVNAGEVIVAATTNLFDETPNTGFEWRKIDAPNEIPSKSAEAPVYDGMIEGILKNIDASSYYKVRPYFMSKDGKYYYGDWIGFDPSDFSYFEPTVKTYDKVEINNGVAKLVGYALKGSDEITEQGFEYWKPEDSNHLTITVSGQRMEANVQNLDGGTTYSYRAYVKTNKGSYYGNEYTFEMPGVSQVEEFPAEPIMPQTRMGVYTIHGQKVADILSGLGSLPRGVYIVNGDKVVVR